MATKRKAFDKLFAQLQDIKDENGHLVNTVLWSKNGDCSVILAMRNPVPRFCTDAEQYINFTEILGNVIQTLGEGYALQKQDIFVKRHYHHEVTDDMEFLTKAISATLKAGNIQTSSHSSSSLRKHSVTSSSSMTLNAGWTFIPKLERCATF